MLRRPQRIRASSEWRTVRRRGRCVSDAYSTLCVLREGETTRFGFTTAKGFGGAVPRNKARRRLREALRIVYSGEDGAFILIGIAKKEQLTVDFAALCRSVAEQLQKLGLHAKALSDGGEQCVG